MASGRPQRPNDPSVMSSIEAAVREVPRPGPLELFWNWRWELGILAATAGLAAIIAASLGLIGLAVTAGAGLAVIVALLRWPPARKRIVARAWCVITPHRVRVGCVHAWVQTRRGKLPLVVSAAPTGYGERVQLWCRAGITAADLLAARQVLAAACWAAEVRVVPSLRYAHVVTLEVNKKSAFRTYRTDSGSLALSPAGGGRRHGRLRGARYGPPVMPLLPSEPHLQSERRCRGA